MHALNSVDGLHRRFADMLVETAASWFDAVRARAPFGRRGMWGQLADDVCASALCTARATGLDLRATWDGAHAVIDLVAGEVPELRVRHDCSPSGGAAGDS